MRSSCPCSRCLLGLAVLAGLLLAAACPVAVTPPDQLSFLCQDDDGCAQGFRCAGNICVPADAPLDAGVVDALAADRRLTDAPTTDAALTDRPTTDRPTTDRPTTDRPTTDRPTADRPTTDRPTTDRPTTDIPTTDMPTADVPTADVPTADVPTADLGIADTAQPDTSPPDACSPPPPPAWWDPSYAYRFPLDVAAAPAGYTIEVSLSGDAASAVFGASLASGSDLRVVRHAGNAFDLDRDLVSFRASAVLLRFQIQEGSGFDGGDDTYFLYVGNPSPDVPSADLRNVYLFFEDFEGFSLDDDGSPTFAPLPDTAWRVVDGGGGSKVYRATHWDRTTARLVNVTLDDGVFEARMRHTGAGGTDNNGLIFRASNMIPASNDLYGGDLRRASSQAGLIQYSNGTYNGFLDASPFTINSDQWYRLVVRFSGGSAWFYVDGAQQASISGASSAGQLLGLHAYVCEVDFDDLKLRQLVDPEPAVALGAVQQPCS